MGVFLGSGSPFVAVAAFPVWSVFGKAFLHQLSVASFAAVVESELQLLDVSLVLGRIVAVRAFGHRIAFLPYVLTVFVNVMAIRALEFIGLGVIPVGEVDRTSSVRLVGLLVEEHFFGRLLALGKGRQTGDKKDQAERTEQDAFPSISHFYLQAAIHYVFYRKSNE